MKILLPLHPPPKFLSLALNTLGEDTIKEKGLKTYQYNYSSYNVNPLTNNNYWCMLIHKKGYL